NNTATAGAGLDVFGGGLLNEGLATVASSRFSGNKALGGQSFSFFGGSVGGGIDNFGGATLTVTDSAFSNNQAISAAGPYFGIGAALENNAGFTLTTPSTANISNSIFLDNLATGGAGAAGNGGALDNEGPGAAMTVTNSALLGNQSVGGPAGDGATTLGQGSGGGVLNFLGALTLRDCALIGNEAVGGSRGNNPPPRPPPGG